MKKGIIAAFILTIIGGSLFFIGDRRFHKHQNQTTVYKYRIHSTGGMGPQLRIESDWEGSVAVYKGPDGKWLVRPSDTSARLVVNGVERKELVERPLKDYEKTFRVSVEDGKGLISEVEYASELTEAALMSILENQIRGLAHLIFTPPASVKPSTFTGACFLGQCEYRLEDKSGEGACSVVRKTLSGINIEARLDIRYDQTGILEIKGFEDTPGSTGTGAETHSSYTLERVSFLDGPLEVEWKSARTIGPSLPEMSVEQKRAIVTNQLQGVGLQSIFDHSKTLNKESNEWGPLYVQLKDFLWLNPEKADELVRLLKNTNPRERFFITGTNALAAQESPESQKALIELIENFKQEKKVAQGLLIALAGTKQPAPSTLDYVKELARWDSPSTHAPTALLARRLSGTLARTMGDTSEAREIISPALDRLEEANDGENVSVNEMIEMIDALGNSGHTSIESQLIKVIQGKYSSEVRATAWSALRFVPGTRITERLFHTAKNGKDETDARAARTALDLRCSLMPAECSSEHRDWVKNSP